MSVFKFKIGDKVKTLDDVPLYGTIVEIYLKDNVTVYTINLDDYKLHIIGNENNIEIFIE